jgi:prepilin-type N-terminal cleavage/methylation domain-containing protein
MKNNRKALTMIEILVASIILAITAAGLSGIFVSGKRYILHARTRMAGGELGSAFIDPLQAAVRQGATSTSSSDGWGQANNALDIASTVYCDGIAGHNQLALCPSANQRRLSNIEYGAQYNISAIGAASNPGRKVTTTINWAEND